MPPGRAGGGPEAAAGLRGGGPGSAASSCPALPGGCGAGRTAPVRRRGPDTRLLRLLLMDNEKSQLEEQQQHCERSLKESEKTASDLRYSVKIRQKPFSSEV